MKYEGKRPSGQDKDVQVYTFTVGRHELEILLRITQNHLENTPKVFEISPYRNRLRNMVRELGTVYVEEIKRKTMPTKRFARTFDTIKRIIQM